MTTRHFRGTTTEATDGTQTIRLGKDLPIVKCFIDELRDYQPYGVFLFLQISGDTFRRRQVLITASSYGSSQLESVVTTGCTQACVFGPILLTGIGRPGFIDSGNPEVEQFEAIMEDRHYRVVAGCLNCSTNMPIEEVEVYRRRLGGPCILTNQILASPLIPVTRSDEAMVLSYYAGIGPHSITGLKLAGAGWPAGRSVPNAIPPEPGGHHVLREWSILMPLEPAPPLTKDGLQYALNLIAAASYDLGSETNWLGSRYHGMRLGPSNFPAGLPLSEDLRWFFSTTAGPGAGPDYGLDIYPAGDGGVHLTDAGCGAEWCVSPYDDCVRLDSRARNDGFTRVTLNFISRCEAWLDHTIYDDGSFGRWSYQVDAAYKILEQSIAEPGIEHLPETVARVKIRTPTKAFDPCHSRQLVCSRYGVPTLVFVTAPSPAP